MTALALRVGFVGTGAMGESILAGLLHSGKFPKKNIGVVGRGTKRAGMVAVKYQVQNHRSVPDLVENCDVICLCIKPKDLKTVSKELEQTKLEGKLLLSTLAGVSLATLYSAFPNAYVVRSIPNIASEICEGVTLWTFGDPIPHELMKFTRHFWGAVGKSIEVEYESYIDAISPISGAAPAFMGMFVEALTDAGVFIGLPRDLVTQVVLESLKGSGELISKEGGNAQLVRQRVTSPAGLTAVCMAELESKGFRTAVMKAIIAGNKKTKNW